MRLASLLLALSVWTLGGCRDSEERVSNYDKQTQEEKRTTGDFYKRLTGNIAGKQVTMHLHRMGNWVGGCYSYDAVGIPISLLGWNDATPGDDVMELQEIIEAGPLDESYTYPRLQLTLTEEGAQGTWVSADSGRRFPIELEEDYGNGSLPLEAISFSDSASLLSSRPLPQATASYATVTPASDNTPWIAEAIKGSLGEGTSHGWMDFFRGLADDYFAGYRADVSVDTSDGRDAESAMYNWSTERHATVLMNEQHWLVLRIFGSDYTGGAHGNHGSSFLVLDRKAERAWTLTEIVADTAALAPFLHTAAVDRWGISPDDPLRNRLLVNTVPVTDNFYLTASGLGFVYNPYEIASYADGEVHLFVPYKRILMLLTDEFKQRMRLANSEVMRG